MQTADQAPQTAEAYAKDQGGRIVFRRDCIVAKFNEPERQQSFVTWLKLHNYQFIDVGTSALCVAYTAPKSNSLKS